MDSAIDGDEKVTIEIEDDGPGMTEEKIKQIFDGNLGETEGHSTGIGISNVIKRLRLFYGFDDVFTIESALGKGTKVVIKYRKKKEREEWNDMRKVLIVDDEQIEREGLKAILQKGFPEFEIELGEKWTGGLADGRVI